MLDGTLFVVCLLLNNLFVLFSSILTCNCIRQTYLVAVYPLNKPSTPYCLFLTAKNIPLSFGVVLRPSKHQPYLCSNFKSSKYFRRRLLCCLFACNYLISAVFKHLNLQLHQRHLCYCSFRCIYSKHSLLFVLNGSKCLINVWCFALAFKTSTVALFQLPNL